MKLDGNELLEQFKDFGITHDSKDKRFQHTLDFQDFVGHQTPHEIRDFYKTLDQDERRTFVFAIMNSQHFDSAVDIIKYTVINNEREKLYSDFDKDIMERETVLFHNTRKLEDAKKYVYKRIAKLKGQVETLDNRIAWLTTHNSTLENSNRQLHACVRNAQKKSADFDNVKAAMALLLDETV